MDDKQCDINKYKKKKTKLYIIIIYICKNLTKYDITATFGKETKQIKIRPSNKKQL